MSRNLELGIHINEIQLQSFSVSLSTLLKSEITLDGNFTDHLKEQHESSMSWSCFELQTFVLVYFVLGFRSVLIRIRWRLGKLV